MSLSDPAGDVNGSFIANTSAKVGLWREHIEHHLKFDTQHITPLLSSPAKFLPPPTGRKTTDAKIFPSRLVFGLTFDRVVSCRPFCSTTLLTGFSEGVLHEGDGVEFAPGHRQTDLDSADDIALLVSSFGGLQSMVSGVNEVAKPVGSPIKAGRTKEFSNWVPDQEKAPLGIDAGQLNEADSLKHLGARLLPNVQNEDDIVSPIDAAGCAFSSFRKCPWIRRDLSIATKICVYRASVRSVLLYGVLLEAGCLTKSLYGG
ncbi:hypothetical protein SprV_1002915100 [Sparganum proliferum]